MALELEKIIEPGLDNLTLSVKRTDSAGNRITDEYEGRPANVGDNVLHDSIFRFWLDNNEPASVTVRRWTAYWQAERTLLASSLSLFFDVPLKQMLELLPPSS